MALTNEIKQLLSDYTKEIENLSKLQKRASCVFFEAAEDSNEENIADAISDSLYNILSQLKLVTLATKIITKEFNND